MSSTEIRIARRVATYMMEIAAQQVDMNFFQGLGLALAVIFEECTGSSAKDKKPQTIIQWAQDLPHEPYPKVRN